MAKVIKNVLGNFLLFCFVFIIVSAWLFSGWPQILKNPPIPPKIQEAKAATVFYFRDATSDIDPGTDEERLLSLDRGSLAATYEKDTVNGPVTPPTVATQFTKVSAGANQIWYTNPLNSVTISGDVTFNLRAKESNKSANVSVTAELLRADNSGSILSVIASVQVPDSELTTNESDVSWSASSTNTSLSAGDRLAIRVYIDDAGGNMSSGYLARFLIDGPTPGGSGDSYFSLTETVTEYVVEASVYVKDGTIGYGTVAVNGGACSTTTSDTQEAINNSGSTENFNIKTTDTTNWNIGTSSPGSEIYTHLFTTTTGDYWQYIDNEYVTLENGVLDTGTSTIDTYIYLPSTTNYYEQQSTTITIQAVVP